MRDFATPNGHHSPSDGTQGFQQPFYAPNSYRDLGQAPAPPLSTGHRSPGVLLASDMHGPYAAGYYTYDRTTQPPQYTYHPDYRHRQPSIYNRDLPDTFRAAVNARRDSDRDAGQGDGRYFRMRSSGVGVARPARHPGGTFEDNNLGASQTNNPANLNRGPPEPRYLSGFHADTGSAARKGPPRKPKSTRSTTGLQKDIGINKTKRRITDLVGDDHYGWAASGMPRKDAFSFDALVEEVGKMMKSELDTPVKETGFLNRGMSSVKPDGVHLPGPKTMGTRQGNQSTPGAVFKEDEKFWAKLHPTAATDDGSVYLDQNKFNNKMRDEVKKLGYNSPAELWNCSSDAPLSKRLGHLTVLSKMFEELLSVYVEGSDEQRLAMRHAMKTMAQSAFREPMDGLNFSSAE